MPSSSGKSHTTPQKLPKLFHKNRDRSKSLSAEATVSTSRGSPTPLDTTPPANAGLESGEPTPRPADVGSLALSDEDLADGDDAPVIIESAPSPSPPPAAIPRPRTMTRAERPRSGFVDAASPPIPVHASASYAPGSQVNSLYASTSSTGSRLSVTDLPSRLSGWFSHMTSAAPAAPPQVLVSPGKSSGSPSKRGLLSNNALMTAARHGKSSLDKAMRFLLDSDAKPDGCTEDIWIMGLQHPGFPPPPEPLETIPDVGERSPSDRLSPTDTRFRQSPGSPRSSIIRSATKRRSPTISGAIGSPPSSFHPPSSPTRGSPSGIGLSSSAHASTPSLQQPSASASSVVLATGAADPNLSPTSVEALAAASGWPQEFFSDFASRLWLTYRSGFAPIRDMSLEDLDPPRSVDELVALMEAFLDAEERTGANDATLGRSASGSSRDARRSSYDPRASYDPGRGVYVNPLPDVVRADDVAATDVDDGPAYATGSVKRWWKGKEAAGVGAGAATDTELVGRRSVKRPEREKEPSKGALSTLTSALTGRRGLTSDAGWGCMLRTGQSLLANALVVAWMGREWRRPDADAILGLGLPFNLPTPDPRASPDPDMQRLSPDPRVPSPDTRKSSDHHHHPPHTGYRRGVDHRLQREAPLSVQDLQPPDVRPPPTDRPVLALTPEHQNLALYIHLLSLFLDSPSPSAPFSVHRMALAGRELGKDVGQWFGPSTAAGAIKALLNAYPDAGLGVAVVEDGAVYQTHVFAASHSPKAVQREKAYASQPQSPQGTMKSHRQPVPGAPGHHRGQSSSHSHSPSSSYGHAPSSFNRQQPFSAGSSASSRSSHQLSPSTSSYTSSRTSFTGTSVTSGGSQRGHKKRRDRRDDTSSQASKRRQKDREHEWGDRPVLILLGTRLGIDGVNPMYYDTIKQLYTLPQSLGIAGGRPSSSYYFVGAQAGELFYLDPHHARPTVPLREVGEVKISATSPAAQGAEPGAAPDALSPPKEGLTRSATTDKKRSKKEKRLSFDTDVEKSDAGGKVSKHKRRHSQHLAAALANASAASSMSSASVADEPAPAAAPLPPPFIPQEPVPVPLPPHSTAPTLPPALAAHYLAGYTAAETRTFHCERVRKMPMSGLDPSMLIGFLCKDRADWDDWRARMGKLSKFPLSIQDEPPNWMPSDVESMSDELIYDDDESEITDGGEGEGQGDDFEGEARPTRRKIDARRLSEDLPLDDNDNSSEATSTSRTEDEDNVDPVTPGPHDTRFSIPEPQGRAKDLCVDDMTIDDLGGAGDIEDDWVEPSPPPTRHSSSTSPPPNATVASPPSIASAPSSTSSSSPPPLAKKKGKRKEKSRAVPVPRVSIPDSAPVAFPRSDAKGDEDEWTEGDEVYYSARDNERSDDAFVNVHVKPKERRMHTARARDGGRTQSGGVRGIMTESSS